VKPAGLLGATSKTELAGNDHLDSCSGLSISLQVETPASSDFASRLALRQ
jgi:hypothetical protein